MSTSSTIPASHHASSGNHAKKVKFSNSAIAARHPPVGLHLSASDATGKALAILSNRRYAARMNLIWCIKKGTARGFKNELAACVTCHCRQRKRCKPYAELSLEKIAAANIEAKKNGYQVVEELPLFESALISRDSEPTPPSPPE